MKLIVGSRGSKLALAQTKGVMTSLAKLGIVAELKIIKTTGDLTEELNPTLGLGFFTKEIEAALLAQEIDLAVHSYKDLPIELPPGLVIGAVCQRGSAQDCLVILPEAYQAAAPIMPLKEGTVVGSSAVRRIALLKTWRPDLQIVPLRGNVTTRLARLLAREEPLRALVLAEVGLQRLAAEPEFADIYEQSRYRLIPLTPEIMVPAPAQGALALEVRATDTALLAALQPLHEPTTALCTRVERALLQYLHAGCSLPFGAYASILEGSIEVKVFYQGQIFTVRGENAEEVLALSKEKLATLL